MDGAGLYHGGNLNIIHNEEDGESSRGRRGRNVHHRGQRGRGRPPRRGGTSSRTDTPNTMGRDPSQPRFQLAIYGDDENDDVKNRDSEIAGAHYNRGRQRERGSHTRGRRSAQKRHSSEQRSRSDSYQPWDHGSRPMDSDTQSTNPQYTNRGKPGRGGRGRGSGTEVIQRATSVENVSEKSRGGRTRIFGYRKLSELSASDKNPDVLLMELNTSRNGFRELLRDENLSSKSDWMVMILSILAQTFSSSQRQSVMELLTAITEEKFLQVNLTPYLNEILSGSVNLHDDTLCTLLENVCILVTEILKRTQMNISAVTLMITVLDAIVTDHRRHFNQELIKQIQEVKSMKEAIQEKREEIKESRSRTTAVKEKYSGESQPPDDFRLLPILPAIKDLQFFERPFLRANKIDGGYDNLNHYLDVQFRLLREDYVRPLREGIADYRRQRAQGVLSKKIQDIRLYEKVQIIRPMCTHRGVLYMIQFDVSKFKGVRWESSRRLLFGSLLCLSFDDFETILFATVTNRDIKELSQGLVQVQFEQDMDISTKDYYIMAETTAYFEAYRHVLEGLQETPDDMPLQRYIVECKTTQKPPKYLLNGIVTYDFSPLRKNNEVSHVPVINPLKWPSARQLDLDDSQYKALKMAVTKEFAIIQGPPGTGKTYVGWKIVHLLLHNKTQWSEEETDPILVVCYTNHALDQFLSEIADFTDKIIRIGGRCASDKLAPFMLKNYRRKARETKSVSKIVHERKSDCLKKMAVCRDKIETVSAKLHTARSGILKKDTLEKYMTLEQSKSLSSRFRDQSINKNDQILIWLELFTNAEPVRDRVFENCPPIFLQWKEELLEGDKIDPMTESEAKKVGNPWMLTLHERAALYKFWLKTFRTNLSIEITKETNRYQKMFNPQWMVDEQILTQISERIANLDADLRRYRSTLLREDRLLYILPKSLSTYVEEIIKKCPKRPQHIHAIDIWMCLEITKQNEALLSETIGQIYEDLVDVEEEASAEDRNRRLNDDDDGDEEMKYMTRTNTQMVQEALSEMSISTMTYTQDSNSDSKWQNVEISKKKIASEIKRLLNIDKLMSVDEASSVFDVWILTRGDRLRLYRYWMDSYLSELRESIADTENSYRNLCQSYKEAMDAEDVEVMAGAEIIGMTTTGAAKYRSIIQQIKPKIIVVEEAAEVLESHIITTINSNCQHLILIGDHKQLRPTPTVYDLALRYNLEISLFERMVQNEMNYTTLQNQHRMRPEISMLMKHIYPDLVDHPSVRTYDHVKGVAKDVFLLNHEQLEMTNEETKSKSNLHEAKFMARFCRYLMQQGYNPSQITMLTTYTGQVLLLKKHMPRKDFEGIRITAVDNYQGEENDIILLSLVRSNKLNNIGFLKIENRICVALSRARMGFYIIGNFGLLAKESNLWENMVYTMVQRQCAGPKLTLCCQNHPMEETIVSKEEDFMAVPNGGCKRMCNSRLSCGHVCEQVCHPEDREHKFYRCFKPCEKIVCSAGHVCLKRCYADCGPCMTAVKKTIPSCSHEHPMPCSKDPTTVDCISPCDTLLDCGHVCKGKCGLCRKKSGHVPCDEKCIKTLSCGHHIESECSTTLENIKCTFKCTSKLTCGHECVGTCYTCFGGKLHMACQQKCRLPLFCGHLCNQNCSEPCPPCKKNCVNRCSHSQCKKKCGEVCDDCAEPCKWKCKHQQCELKCSEKCNRPPCFTQCSKKLSCGCPCLGFCGEKCPQICPKCNKSEFEEITIHISDKPSVRLVALEECNDVFEASFFDEYMSSEETSSSTSFPVETKKCPKCSTLITKSNRYCGTLRAISNDINTVKKCMKVDAEESNRRKKRLISKIEALKEQDEDAANDLAKNPEIKKKNETASIETLDLLDNQINIILEVYDIFTIVKRRDIDSSVKRDVASLLIRIRNWVLREHFLPSKKAKLNTRWRRGFTQQEIEELINEFCRLRYIINISFMKKEKKANALGTYLTEAVEKLEHKFSSEEEIHLKRLIKVAVRFVPDLIPVIKLKLIVTKGVAENGKWYKCLNGHIGQVKEAIRACHECHLMVGPGSYTPRVHYPPDPVPVDSYIPFFTEKDVDATESLTKESVSLGSSEHALPSEAGQLQGEIFDSQFTGVGIPVNDRSLEASNSFGTLQPGLIISSLQQAHEDTSEAGSSQCERSAQRNMKYVFKCSNGHFFTYAISEVPHKCPRCTSTLFTQVREKTGLMSVDSKGTSSRNIEQVDTDSVSLSRNSKDSRGKESSDTDRKKKEFSLVVRCNAGHVMPKDAVKCQICDIANRRKIQEERKVNQGLLGEREKEHAEMPTENVKKTCPKGHILRPDQTDCRLCKYLVDNNLTKISTSSSKSSGVAGELQTSAYSTTQQSEGRPFQSKTSQPASEGTDEDKNSLSKSIPPSSDPSKPVTRKCHKGHVMLRNETECSWCRRSEDMIQTINDAPISHPRGPIRRNSSRNQENDDRSSEV